MPRLLRHLGHPLASLLLIGVVVLDVQAWTYLAPVNHRPIIRGMRIPLLTPGPVALRSHDIDGLLIGDGPVPRFISRSQADGLAPVQYSSGNVRTIAALRANPRPRHIGLIAPVITQTSHTLTIVNYSRAPLTPDQIAVARTGFAEALTDRYTQRGKTSPIPALLAAGDGTLTELNTLPLINDLLITPIILLAAASTTLSLTRAVRAHSRRKSPHLCPTCRYDLTGLPVLGTCPECGDTR